MRKILTVAAAGLVLLGATAAQAASTIYKITKIDAATRTITLGNNQTYVVDAGVMLDEFKVGDQVRVTFTSDNGKNTATAVVKL